jgi:hypothetical protein
MNAQELAGAPRALVASGNRLLAMDKMDKKYLI